jgi:O-antigen ligase
VLTVAGVVRYPLPAWPLAVALLAYAAALWRWPALFLLILPIVIPAYDLGLWTGWMVVGESDLFVLATIAVLLLRTPPRRADLLPARWPSAVLLLLITAYAISTIIGLTRPLGFTGHSDNPFLRPDNALRLAKAPIEALALLPFIRNRQRTHGDALAWFGCGMAAGLVVVTLETLAERVLFTNGVLDFSTDYRVAGPFSSMRVGGGHIGAYVALALPFVLGVDRGRIFRLAAPLALLAGIGGAYTLAVTYARAAYAAGLASTGLAALLWLLARWRRGGSPLLAILPVVLILAGLGAASSSEVMRARFGDAAADLITRESNWRDGWAVRDRAPLTTVFGMGLGTYQRTMLARSPVNQPSDLSVERDAEGAWLEMRVKSPFYLGQKVTLPDHGEVHLDLRFRAIDAGAVLGVSLCDKVLLYSDNCRGPSIRPASPGTWEAVSVPLPVEGLGRSALHGLLRRPVELSLFDQTQGTALDLRDVRLTDAAGHSLLANGDFAHGLDRWIFTDDSHVSWRILNQYLMWLFETGVVGLLAMLGLCGLAIAGGVRSAWSGEPMGAAVAGSVVAFLLSGLFDNVMEAPRVATLVFLVCLAGLILWQDQPLPSDEGASDTATGRNR